MGCKPAIVKEFKGVGIELTPQLAKELAGEFKVVSALGGHRTAAWILTKAVLDPAAERNQYLIQALRKYGFEPGPEIGADLHVLSGLNFHPTAALYLADAIAFVKEEIHC